MAIPETASVLTPEALLARFAAEGDPRALAALFDATAPDLFRLALHLVPINDEILNELNKISASAIKVFEDSMESLFDEEYQEANVVMEAAEETSGMEDEVIHKIVKLAPVEDVPQLRLIVESIMRTSEYGADIAETVLNMTVNDAVTEA